MPPRPRWGPAGWPGRPRNRRRGPLNTPARQHRGAHACLSSACSAALALYALLLIYHAVRLAFTPGEVNYAEATWLLAALRARHGLNLDFDYQHAPYIPIAYPPFMPELAGVIGGLLNLPDAAMIPLAGSKSWRRLWLGQQRWAQSAGVPERGGRQQAWPRCSS